MEVSDAADEKEWVIAHTLAVGPSDPFRLSPSLSVNLPLCQPSAASADRPSSNRTMRALYETLASTHSVPATTHSSATNGKRTDAIMDVNKCKSALRQKQKAVKALSD